MVTFGFIFEKLTDNLKNGFSFLIKNKVITENQIKQTFINLFGINETSSVIEIRRGANRLIIALFELYKYIVANPSDNNAVERTVKRLISKNSAEETVNELICHYILGISFTNYIVNPLFLEGPDGKLHDSQNSIPVEIKSRFPNSVEYMGALLNGILSKIPNYDDFTLYIDITIVNYSKLNVASADNHVNEVIHFIFNNVEQVNNAPANFVKEFIFKEVTIHVKIEVVKSIIINRIEADNRWRHSNFVASIQGKLMPDGKTRLLLNFSSSLSEEVEQKLSNEIFSGFFTNSDNKPIEPRILVFKTGIWVQDMFTEYYNKLFSKYVEKNTGTMLLGVIDFFTEREQDTVVGIKFQSIGSEIKNTIANYYKGKLDT